MILCYVKDTQGKKHPQIKLKRENLRGRVEWLIKSLGKTSC